MAGWGATTSPISRLVQRLNDDALLRADEEGVAKDALFLADTCRMIEAMLGDAEEREIRDTSVKLWLHDLKNLAADVEDLLEEYDYHLHLVTIEGEASSAAACGRDEIENEDGKEKHIQVTFPNELSERIRTIRSTFDDIYVRKEKLQLKKNDGKRRLETPVLERQVGHLANEPIIYGRDKDKKYLVDLLKKNDLLDLVMPNKKNEYVSVVVSLVGIGGIGKTTLVQAIYKDEEINRYFDCKAWVTVSEAFDVVQIAKDFLESLTRKACNLTQLSVIQEELVSQLQGKKFLLVLDDIWEEKLDNLGFLLQMGSLGSKIVITTRISRVANGMLPSKVVNLESLLEEDGWELFRSHALGGKSEDCVAPDLVGIGKKIVEKCKGIPLLLKVLGDDLQEAGTNKNKWIEVLNHETWDIKDEYGNNNIMEILKLSYYHLPRRLRQCFLYCSVFPKDYEFNVGELHRLWAAYGLIEIEGSRQVNDIGEECVKGLLGRSFMQMTWRSKFSMHDIMHDLAQYMLCSEQSLTKNPVNTLDLHHPLMMATSRILNCCYEPIVGRTLFIHSKHPFEDVPKIDMLDQYLKRLRVLIIDCLYLEVIPDSIGNLKHLRYLCVRSVIGLRSLPDSVCSLYNLQTLDCPNLQELPRDMKRLKRLQHLLVNPGNLPPGIGNLVELQTLEKFHVYEEGKHNCARLSELKDLRRLGGKIRISGLNNVNRAEEAKLSSLSGKPNLKHLELEWDYNMQDDCRHRSKLVLDNLKPHDNLEVLGIFCYTGVWFPKWLEGPSFAMLTNVILYGCSNCMTLPTLGQLPSLEILCLERMNSLKSIGPEFYGTSPLNAFPSLQDLDLYDMDSLTEWWGMDKCPFPQLHRLSLHNCPSLCFMVEHQAGLCHMFNTVDIMIVESCPHLKKWCKAHAFTTLAKVETIRVDKENLRWNERSR